MPATANIAEQFFADEPLSSLLPPVSSDLSAPRPAVLASLASHVSTTKPPLVTRAIASSSVAAFSPFPHGALRIADAPVGMVASPPCRRSLLRLFRAALGLAGLSLSLGLHLSLCFLCFLLGSFAVYCGWALWRQGQALRVARKYPHASLDTSPSAVEALRKKEAKKKPQRASRGSGRATP